MVIHTWHMSASIVPNNITERLLWTLNRGQKMKNHGHQRPRGTLVGELLSEYRLEKGVKEGI